MINSWPVAVVFAPLEDSLLGKPICGNHAYDTDAYWWRWIRARYMIDVRFIMAAVCRASRRSSDLIA